MTATTNVDDGHPGSSWADAWRDLRGGIAHWPLWLALGWHDIRLRYRRSVLGPLWITLSLAIWVGLVGSLFSVLFNQPFSMYIPYLTAGMLSWQFISNTLLDGCTAFSSASNFIKQSPTPYTTFALRAVWRNLIIFTHNLLVFVAVSIMLLRPPTPMLVLLLPGMGLLCINALWVTLLFGAVGARFRDVPPIVQSLIGVAFFVTPIIWHVDLMQNRSELVGGALRFNPFYHFVELVRAPLLGSAPEAIHWAVAVGITVVGSLLALVVFVQMRQRLAFWV